MQPFVEDFSKLGDDGERGKNALEDHIYLDAMGFGMGCCCLQLTFQACNINEARILYDQLATMCPIMVNCIFYVKWLKDFLIIFIYSLL